MSELRWGRSQPAHRRKLSLSIARRSPGILASIAIAAGSLAAAGCGPAPTAEPPKVTAPATTSAPSSIAEPPRPPLTGDAVLFLDTDRPTGFTLVAVSPDASRVAVADVLHKLRVHGGRDGTKQLELDMPGDVQTLLFSADGARLCATTELGAVVWDAKTGEPVFSTALPGLGLGRYARFTPSGQWLVVLDHAGALRVLDATTGALAGTATLPAGARIDAISVGSDRLLTEKGASHVLWELPSAKKLADVEGDLSPDLRLAMFHDDATGTVSLRDAVTRAELWHRRWGTYSVRVGADKVTHAALTYFIAWSPDSARVAMLTDIPGTTEIAGSDSAKLVQLALVDVASRKHAVAPSRLVLEPPPEWSRDSKRVFAGLPPRSGDTVVQVGTIDAATRKLVREDTPPGNDLARSADPRGTLAVSVGNTVAVVDGKTGAPLWNVDRPRTQGVAWRFDEAIASPSAPWLAFTRGRDDKALRVVRLDRGEMSAALLEGPGYVPEHLFAGGPTLVGLGTGFRPGGFATWMFDDAGQLQRTGVSMNATGPIAVSDDGAYVASAGGKGVTLFDAKTGRSLPDLQLAEKPTRLSFGPRGALLAIASGPQLRTVKVPSLEPVAEIDEALRAWWWRPDGALGGISGEQVYTFDATTGDEVSSHKCAVVNRQTVSRWGDFVVGGTSLFELASCTRKATLPGGPTKHVFSSDSKHLVTVIRFQGVALIHSTETGALERTIRVPDASDAIGASGDFVVFHTRTGAVLIRPDTGASYRVDFADGPGGTGMITSIDRGHFDTTDALAPHVGLFFPGTKQGPVARIAGSGPDPFRRARLHLDVFGPAAR